MSRFKVFVDAMLAILAIGFITLTISQARTLNQLKALNNSSEKTAFVDTASPSSKDTSSSSFSLFEEANTALQASVSSLLNRLEILEKTDTPTTSTSVGSTSYTPQSTTSTFQPQDIYLGNAFTHNTNWEDTSLEASLYSEHYPASVNVYFEAGLSIIGGEVWARLKNKTTGAIISVTELSHNNNTVTWKNSSAFKLHPGNNIYLVQLKSTSGEKANLAGARIKITQ
jgi:hypothetical protein